jgi:hypothetical protein
VSRVLPLCVAIADLDAVRDELVRAAKGPNGLAAALTRHRRFLGSGSAREDARALLLALARDDRDGSIAEDACGVIEARANALFGVPSGIEPREPGSSFEFTESVTTIANAESIELVADDCRLLAGLARVCAEDDDDDDSYAYDGSSHDEATVAGGLPPPPTPTGGIRDETRTRTRTRTGTTPNRSSATAPRGSTWGRCFVTTSRDSPASTSIQPRRHRGQDFPRVQLPIRTPSPTFELKVSFAMSVPMNRRLRLSRRRPRFDSW